MDISIQTCRMSSFLENPQESPALFYDAARLVLHEILPYIDVRVGK